jgi:nucleoside-diphosphate-sugar epimerase
MKVFVTGATGYIGRSVVRALLRAGHLPVGLARDAAAADKIRDIAGVRWVKGDLAEPKGWEPDARGCEALIHLGFEMSARAVELDKIAVETLLRVAHEVRSFRTVVYTSGVWVLGSTGDRRAHERTPLQPAPIVAWRPAHEERVLLARNHLVGTSVVRPGIVFGHRGGLFSPIFESATRSGAASFTGNGENRWPTVHVDDLADLYLRLVELPGRSLEGDSHARTFHGVDGSTDTVGAIARAASQAAGKGGRTAPVPVEKARESMGAVADALVQDQIVETVSCDRIGWRPRLRGFVANAALAFAEWSSGA